jgi:hypothetical protein
MYWAFRFENEGFRERLQVTIRLLRDGNGTDGTGSF